MKNIFSSLILLIFFISSCKNDEINPKPLFEDGKKPAAVTNVKVENYEGGAIITYDLTADPSILYVQADYSINNVVTRQEKSSYYSDTIRVGGFAQAGAYKVQLRTVNKSEIKSDPVEITVNPLTPPYLTMGKNLLLLPDFGGINISYSNPNESDVGVVVIVDSLDDYEYLDTKYLRGDREGNFSVRGMQTVERTFGAYVRDRWGNISDTVFVTTTPFREVELDRTKMVPLNLPGDGVPCCGSTTSTPLTNNGASDWAAYGVFRLSYDFGQPVKLSRFKLWIRVNGIAEFINGTPKTFKVYGSNKPNPDGSLDDSWTQMGGVYEIVKPSGLPYGKRNAEDDAAKYEGFEYVMPLPAISVRYWRIAVIANYAQGKDMDIAALRFWGDPQ